MPNPNGDWTQREIDLLGTDYDGAVAATIGRTKEAVRSKRREALIPPFILPAGSRIDLEALLPKMRTERLQELVGLIEAELAKRHA